MYNTLTVLAIALSLSFCIIATELPDTNPEVIAICGDPGNNNNPPPQQ